MSVSVNFKGRLGNNILQYLMGQYISDKFDLHFDSYIDLNDDFEIKRTSGSRFFENKVELNDDNIFYFLEKRNIDHGFLLNGYFQNKNIFDNQNLVDFYRERIVPKFIENPSHLFIHVRLGDIENKFNLPYKYYYDQISKIDYKDSFLSTEEKSLNHKIIKCITKNFHNVNLFTGWNPSFVIRYAANCEKLVLSAGSFSFCMALFRNNNSKIYCIDNEVMQNIFNIRKWDGGMFSSFIGRENFNFYNR